MDKLHELLEIMKEHQKLDRLVQGARSAARSAAWTRERDWMLELLREES